jgi:hypothetical protein
MNNLRLACNYIATTVVNTTSLIAGNFRQFFAASVTATVLVFFAAGLLSSCEQNNKREEVKVDADRFTYTKLPMIYDGNRVARLWILRDKKTKREYLYIMGYNCNCIVELNQEVLDKVQKAPCK